MRLIFHMHCSAVPGREAASIFAEAISAFWSGHEFYNFWRESTIGLQGQISWSADFAVMAGHSDIQRQSEDLAAVL